MKSGASTPTMNPQTANMWAFTTRCVKKVDLATIGFKPSTFPTRGSQGTISFAMHLSGDDTKRTRRAAELEDVLDEVLQRHNALEDLITTRRFLESMSAGDIYAGTARRRRGEKCR